MENKGEIDRLLRVCEGGGGWQVLVLVLVCPNGHVCITDNGYMLHVCSFEFEYIRYSVSISSIISVSFT